MQRYNKKVFTRCPIDIFQQKLDLASKVYMYIFPKILIPILYLRGI